MNSKLGILNKIKALVAKTGKSILWRGKPKENEISEKIAQKIQKNAYDLSLRVIKDNFTPPYLQLAEQLQIEDEQIFRAAVYNLANIAVARPKYRKAVLDILQGHLNNSKLPFEKQEYLRKKIKYVDSLSSH